jgi:hypothetical protein
MKLSSQIRENNKMATISNQFQYRFSTDFGLETGVVEAADATDAATKVLMAGDEPRWKQHGISDKVLARIPDTELIDISSSNQKYSLSLIKVGTRKRKPARVLDVWS